MVFYIFIAKRLTRFDIFFESIVSFDLIVSFDSDISFDSVVFFDSIVSFDSVVSFDLIVSFDSGVSFDSAVSFDSDVSCQPLTLMIPPSGGFVTAWESQPLSLPYSAPPLPGEVYSCMHNYTVQQEKIYH